MLLSFCLKADVLGGLDLRCWLSSKACSDSDFVSSTRGLALSFGDGSRALVLDMCLSLSCPSRFSVFLRFLGSLFGLFATQRRYFEGPHCFDVPGRPVIFEVGGRWRDVRSRYVCSGESTDEG